MIPVHLRRAGRGPTLAPGVAEREGRGTFPRLTGSSGEGQGPPTGLGGPAPRLRLSAARYLSGRAAWRQSVHDRAAQRQTRLAERQAFRDKVSEMTGGRLSTERSHRGFISAMGAFARREQGEPSRGDHPPDGGLGAGDPIKAYFDRRQARLAKYRSMRGGVSPRRSDITVPEGDHPPPEPKALEGPGDDAPRIEEID